MSDTATLRIKVTSDEVSTADKRLQGLEKSGRGAERATDGLTGAFRGLLAPLAAAVSATATLTKLVDVQRQFDVLNAGLITATGSSEKAAVAFEALREFAAKTPYDLGQAVEGFTKLVNLGLTPSEAALTSYGNTASAMGKNLNDMIEAVADASTGEFERLKEFGIKASSEGDRVKFTFQGVTTEIGKNAGEIEQYLMKIGETSFAGAMEQRMNSLDGAIANLGDTWDQLFLTVSQSGVGDLIETAVRMATDALQELTDMVASGELEGYLDAVAGKFDDWGGDIQQTIQILTNFYKDNLSQFEDEGASTVQFLIDAFKNFPENVRAFIQIMVVEVAAGLDKVSAYAGAFKDGVKAIFNDDTFAGVGARLEGELSGINSARESSLETIMAEREASITSFDKQIEKAKQLRNEYDKNQAAKAAQTGDRLAEFGLNKGTPGKEDSEEDSKADKKAAKEAERLAKKEAQLEAARKRELDSLVESLYTEEEAIASSYERRMQIIAQNLEAGSAKRTELEDKVKADRDKQMEELEASRASERDQLYNGLLTEEEMLAQSYERKKQAILDSENVTGVERQDLMKRLEEQYATEQADLEVKRNQTQLANMETLFGGLAGLAKAYGGEQSKAYRALFAVSKAFSVAQAVMSISTGLAKAQELGFPANLAEMARVGATGAGILAQINGANFSGAYDKGGLVPAGKIGLVGEYGPELIEGPAKVTSRAETARMLRDGGESTPVAAPPVNIKNINVLDPSVVGDYLSTDDGEQMIMNVVQKNQNNLGK